MRLILISILFFITLNGVAQSTKLLLKNFPKNTKILLYQRNFFVNKVVDSFYIIDDNVKNITLSSAKTYRYFLKVENVPNVYIPFINENKKVTITYLPEQKLNSKTYWPLNYITDGGKENAALSKLMISENYWNNKLIEKFDKRDSLDAFKDSSEYILTKKLIDLYNKQRDSSLILFIKQNRNSFAALDFYSSEYNRMIFVPELANMFKKLSSKLRETDDGNWIESILFPKLQIGQSFIEIEARDMDNNKIHLSDYIGKIILLDFWASWCIPCLAEYEKLKPIYESHKKNGFEIFAVSVDENRNNWINSITKNNYQWINVAEKGGQNSMSVKNYGIHQYPTNFLIDINGKIIRKNITVQELETYLKNR